MHVKLNTSLVKYETAPLYPGMLDELSGVDVEASGVDETGAEDEDSGLFPAHAVKGKASKVPRATIMIFLLIIVLLLSKKSCPIMKYLKKLSIVIFQNCIDAFCRLILRFFF